MQQAFRYELAPNAGQRMLLAKHAGTARFAWNWALAERIRRYRENEGRARSTNAMEQHNSRKLRGSRNRARSAVGLARRPRRIRNIRTDFLHKLSTTLARTKSVVVLEDLNVRGMIRNHRLARHIADAGWSSFRRMLEYKAQWYGSKLIVAPRFLPSSKTCSECGHVLDALALSVRTWTCPACGVDHDRDVNAARVLLVWYRLTTGSSPGSHACGEPSGGAEAYAATSYGSTKQESAVERLSSG